MYISDEELEYHQRVVADFAAASQEFEVAKERAIGAKGALLSWAQHLAAKYGLSSVDQVNDDGEIVRPGGSLIED